MRRLEDFLGAVPSRRILTLLRKADARFDAPHHLSVCRARGWQGTAQPRGQPFADGRRSERATIERKMRVFWSEQKARLQWLVHSPWMAPLRSVVLGSNFLPDSQICIGAQ